VQFRSWAESFDPTICFQAREAETRCFKQRFSFHVDAVADAGGTGETHGT